MTRTWQRRHRIPRIPRLAASCARALSGRALSGRALSVWILTFAVIGTPAAQAQTYTVLHRFTGADGQSPSEYGHLIGDSAGDIYGTTVSGGASGAGVVFKLNKTTGETVLHSFTGGADGGLPQDGLIRDSAGNLYGTTSAGGESDGGVVFKVDTTGTETVLYNFKIGRGGAVPYTSLIQDSEGNLYGTTTRGGASRSGVVFKLNTTGTETPLYSFTGGADGENPYSDLIPDSEGNLYGTTVGGGVSIWGVVFKLDKTGTETVLHSFTGGADGGFPLAGVIRDSEGDLYGTTQSAGISLAGVVFKLDPTGTETVLYAFTGGADGAYPLGGLIRDSAGNLYGTASGGGASRQGVVFKLDPTGTETVLYNFTGGADGGFPQAGLTLDSAGNLYGTTYYGGSGPVASGHGVVFMIQP
jgi:uncharacterized repeat protein (TIGR03803 family)